MSHDEVVRGGDEDQSHSYGWVLIVVVGVLAALVSILGHHAKPASKALPVPSLSPLPPPRPLPSTATSQPPQQLVSHPPRTGLPTVNPVSALLDEQSGYVQVRDVCPVLTDHRTRVDVTVVLQNITSRVETLQSVTAVLSTPGLHPTGVDLQTGSCNRRTGKPMPVKGTVLPAGGVVLVSLRLGLPHGCPAPYPVAASVTVGLLGVLRQEEVSVFTDLGDHTADLCNRTATG